MLRVTGKNISFCKAFMVESVEPLSLYFHVYVVMRLKGSKGIWPMELRVYLALGVDHQSINGS